MNVMVKNLITKKIQRDSKRNIVILFISTFVIFIALIVSVYYILHISAESFQAGLKNIVW
jgi:hypothetical protein